MPARSFVSRRSASCPNRGRRDGVSTRLGKRYECADCGTVVLCVKAGSADLECCDRPMREKEMEQLPSGD